MIPGFRTRKAPFCLLLAALLFGTASAGYADTTPAGVPYSTEIRPEIAKLKPAPASPKSIDDLKAIQDRVEAVAKYALPATVGIRIAAGFGEVEEGSGIIVTKDGYVLTAGHVSGKPGTAVQIRFSNGRIAAGKSLGADNQSDSGMIKITTPGDYPFVPLAPAGGSRLREGQWVVAMGHPGGIQNGRPPVLRIGRVLNIGKDHSRGGTTYVQTDCELIMGDSGGPLFDLDGRLVGINSRIGIQVESNVHVPIDAFTKDWARLARGEQWNNAGFLSSLLHQHEGEAAAPTQSQGASLGVKADDGPNGPQLTYIRPNAAAEHARLSVGDVITQFDGQPVKSFQQLSDIVGRHKPGDVVSVELLRNDKPVQTKVTLEAPATY